jgi:tRNA G37 N-methylase TrmD
VASVTEVSTRHRKITKGRQEPECKVTKNNRPQIQYKHKVKNIQRRQMQNVISFIETQ